jgi:hypothetical protein
MLGYAAAYLIGMLLIEILSAAAIIAPTKALHATLLALIFANLVIVCDLASLAAAQGIQGFDRVRDIFLLLQIVFFCLAIIGYRKTRVTVPVRVLMVTTSVLSILLSAAIIFRR